MEISLHGGTAFRAALYAAWQDRLDVDLFDLVPFNSDIDLEHSGSPEKTVEIAAYIDNLVPFASWCRWSINDGDRAEQARIQRDASTDIPLRRIRFSTEAPAYVPANAHADIEGRRVSFARNSRFGQSDAQLRPDVEIFGLLVALNTWSEADEIAGGTVDFDVGGAIDWLREGLSDEEWQLFEKPAIAARFWHLLSTRLARHGPDPISSALAQLGRPILEGIGAPVTKFFESDRAISVSRVTSTADFRVPQLTPEIVTGEAAISVFGEVIRQAAERVGYPAEALPGNTLDLIDPSLELVGVVPNLTLLPYGSGKEGEADLGDPFLSGVGQEFVQFAWHVEASDALNAQGLTGQMLALGARDFGTATAMPVVGGTFGRSRAWLRVRLDDLIEAGQEGAPVEAALLIFQARPDEAEETERGPNKQRHSVPGEAIEDEDRRPAHSYAFETARITESEEPAYATVTI
ncbi:hypothetical protein ASD39_24635 [Sphingomonas sp. Root50]|nr:hypothetical protein ASD17_25400 [Sphingomonas sp. Root1294]KQY69556.1 hypothetical protein ASD39_24635 [Sphingomonas sp. Root50]KRB87484.1 hypothetical protein ASE22_24185 [Sphingomonas sp. Root720]